MFRFSERLEGLLGAEIFYLYGFVAQWKNPVLLIYRWPRRKHIGCSIAQLVHTRRVYGLCDACMSDNVSTSLIRMSPAMFCHDLQTFRVVTTSVLSRLRVEWLLTCIRLHGLNLQCVWSASALVVGHLLVLVLVLPATCCMWLDWEKDIFIQVSVLTVLILINIGPHNGSFYMWLLPVSK